MKRFVMGMLVLACMSLAAGAYAGIQTIDVYGEVPILVSPDVPWIEDLKIDKFDPNLGTLMSVHVWIHGEIYGKMGFEHMHQNAGASFFDLNLEGHLQVGAPPGAGPALPVDLIKHEREDNVPKYDGAMDFDGASGTTWPFLATGDVGPIIVDSSFFPQYIGLGQLSIPCSSIASSLFTTDSVNWQKLLETNAKAKVHIAYDYEPVIPEMGSLALAILGGFIGLPLFRRFKK